jgi:hypothetical protein
VVECLPSKHDALNSYPSAKKKEKEKNKQLEWGNGRGSRIAQVLTLPAPDILETPPGHTISFPCKLLLLPSLLRTRSPNLLPAFGLSTGMQA